jgi:hypothetical protein
VADDAIVEDGFQNPRFNPFVILSGVLCREGSVQFFSAASALRGIAQVLRRQNLRLRITKVF